MLKFCILFLFLILSTSHCVGLTIDIPSPIIRGQTVTVSYTRALGDPIDFVIGTQGVPSFEVQSEDRTAWEEQYPVSDQFPTGTFTLEAFSSNDELVGSGASILGVSNEFTVLDSGTTLGLTSATEAETAPTSSVPSSSPTSSSPTTSSSSTPSSSPTPSSSSSKIPAIIGGVIGGLIVLAIFTFFAVRHRLSRQHENNTPQLRSVNRSSDSSRWHVAPFESTASSSGASNSNRFREKRPLLQEQRDEVSRLREQLEQATSNSSGQSSVIGSPEESPLVIELRQRIQELTELLAPPPGYEEAPKT